MVALVLKDDEWRAAGAAEAMGDTMSATLRTLYDAACHAGLDSVEGRTFEEWKERVSDYGLDDARQSLEIWKQELERQLATTFVKWTKERDPAERTRLWQEMHEMGKRLEYLNEGTTTLTTVTMKTNDANHNNQR